MTQKSVGGAFLTGSLVLISLISGYLAYSQVRGLLSDDDPMVLAGDGAVSEGPAATATRPFILPELGALDQTLRRPLFTPSREQEMAPSPAPAPIVAKPAKPKISSPPKVVLKGVIVSRNRRAALIAMSDQPDVIWVDEGDAIQGWKITSIGSAHLTLRSGDSIEQVRLDRESKRP